MTVPVGVKGRIRNAGVKEPYVFVQDDLSNTEGYLVLTSDNIDFTTGYDGWVLKNDLDEYFQEAGWDVQWLEDTTSIPGGSPSSSQTKE